MKYRFQGKIPYQIKKGRVILLQSKWANAAIYAINGLRNLTARVIYNDGTSSLPATDCMVTFSDNGVNLDIPLPIVPAQGGSSAGVTWLRLKQDLGSSLQCVTWDGTTEGTTPIYVAKQPVLRINVSSQTIRGVVYNYTYASTAGTSINYWTRTTAGGASTTEIATPDFLFNADIYAITIPAITLDGHACTLMDTSPRCWGTQ